MRDSSDQFVIKLEPLHFSPEKFHMLSKAKKEKIRTMLLIGKRKEWIKDIVMLILRTAF